jgi:hypothetical protein
LQVDRFVFLEQFLGEEYFRTNTACMWIFATILEIFYKVFVNEFRKFLKSGVI